MSMSRYLINWFGPVTCAIVMTVVSLGAILFFGVTGDNLLHIYSTISTVSLNISVPLLGLTITLYSIILSFTSKELWKKKNLSSSKLWESFSNFVKKTVAISIINIILAFTMSILVYVEKAYRFLIPVLVPTSFTLGLVIGCTAVNTKTIISIATTFSKET